MKRRRSIQGVVKINCPFDKCKRTIFKDQKYCFQHLERGTDQEIKDIFFSGKCDIIIPDEIIIYIFILGTPHKNKKDIKSYQVDKITSYFNDRLILSKTIYKMLNPLIKWNILWFNSSYSERVPLQSKSESMYYNKKDLSIPTNYNAKKLLSIKLQIDRLEKEKSNLQKTIHEECTGIKINKRDYGKFEF